LSLKLAPRTPHRPLPATQPSQSVDPAALAAQAWRHVQSDEPALAAAVYEQLRYARPADARLLCNLSYLYERTGDFTAAEDRARLAVRLAPQLAEGWNNLGLALREQHRLDEAHAAFDRAVMEQPDFALAKFNRATTALLAGNYRLGWPDYEQRERLVECTGPRPALPRWQGERLAGRPLVVSSEQGAGDALQFARFLPEIQTLADGPLWLLVPQALQRLMQTTAGVQRVITDVAECPNDGAAIPLGSLPGVLNLDLAQLPWRTEYLAAPKPDISECRASRSTECDAASALLVGQAVPDRTLHSVLKHSVRHSLTYEDAPDREEMPGFTGQRIGLVWQGNPQQGRDHVRSCALRELRALASVPNVEWSSLQLGDVGRRQLADVPDWPIVDLAPQLHDFADTAAVIAQLDLVITVDTAVAHLCGALNRPAWVLLGHTPDWRWGLTGETCPWYLSLRLFRQTYRGDWAGVVQRVVRALRCAEPARRG
jgi:hypothetical protein